MCISLQSDEPMEIQQLALSFFHFFRSCHFFSKANFCANGCTCTFFPFVLCDLK